MPGSFEKCFQSFKFQFFKLHYPFFQFFKFVFVNFPIFQVEVHKFPIFQVKDPILSSLKKGTSGQPLFGFPIFQDFDFQFFKMDHCSKQIFAQGPINCLLQVLDQTLSDHGEILSPFLSSHQMCSTGTDVQTVHLDDQEQCA